MAEEEITAESIELDTCAMLTAIWFNMGDELEELIGNMTDGALAGVAVRVGQALLSFLAHEAKSGVGGSVTDRIRESARKATAGEDQQ